MQPLSTSHLLGLGCGSVEERLPSMQEAWVPSPALQGKKKKSHGLFYIARKRFYHLLGNIDQMTQDSQEKIKVRKTTWPPDQPYIHQPLQSCQPMRSKVGLKSPEDVNLSVLWCFQVDPWQEKYKTQNQEMSPYTH